MLRLEVKQPVNKFFVEPCRHLAIHNQGGRGSNAQLEQFVPGFFVDHDIFMGEFYFFAGQILCQCRTGASEGLRIQSDLPAAHNSILVYFFSRPNPDKPGKCLKCLKLWGRFRLRLRLRPDRSLRLYYKRLIFSA